MTKSIKIVSALLVVAATTGTALAATSSPPFKGSGNVDVSRSTPVSLPKDIKPIPTPKVDRDQMSRDVVLDTEGMVDALGAVSINRDGTIEETPASEELRDIIERMMANPGN
ncbi:MAG: hypothetical protein ABL879_16690 [Devosia sp.]